jgi:transcriptional regulator with XRE-family HTH domain
MSLIRPEERFAERIRAVRKAAGLSQREVVERVNATFGYGWHQTVAAKIEANDRPIRLDEAAALVMVLAPLLVASPPSLAKAMGDWAEMLRDLVSTESNASAEELEHLANDLRKQIAEHREAWIDATGTATRLAGEVARAEMQLEAAEEMLADLRQGKEAG